MAIIEGNTAKQVTLSDAIAKVALRVAELENLLRVTVLGESPTTKPPSPAKPVDGNRIRRLRDELDYIASSLEDCLKFVQNEYVQHL